MQYILKKGVWRVFSAVTTSLDGLTRAEQETELHCIVLHFGSVFHRCDVNK